jgi:hypothetical protein
MTMWNDNEDAPIAAERAELRKLRAEVERLQGVIHRNCDPMAMSLEDAAVVEEINRIRALEPKS